MIICGLLFILIVIYVSSCISEEKEERRKIINDKFNNLIDFETTKKIDHDDNFIFAIDEKHQKVAYIDKHKERIIPFEQIYKVEYIENATIVASKSSIRTVGGALVGGAIAGGAGAIVGGLSGDTKMKNKITLMQVKLGLRSINDPALAIDVLKSGAGIDPWVEDYRNAIKCVNDIVDSVSVIIDKVDNCNRIQPTEDNSHSVADELSKLARLKETGVLTEKEFEEQKQKLLNK